MLRLYLITPWQYPPRLDLLLKLKWQQLFYILSRLGSICRGLACYSISYHALVVSAKAISYRALAVFAKAISYHAFVVSAEAWHVILYLNLSKVKKCPNLTKACGSESLRGTC